MRMLYIILLSIFGYFLASVIAFILFDKKDPYCLDNWWLAMFWPIFVILAPIVLWKWLFDKIHEKHLDQLEERNNKK